MRSEAKTIEQYLAMLPENRRHAISEVRKVIVKNLPRGYEEVINWGMITYQVPLAIYPDTYNGQPLMYAALALQRNHMTIYLTGIYASAHSRKKFESNYKASGKRLDMGKSCVRFKKLEDLPLALIGETIASLKVEEFLNTVKKVSSSRGKSKKK